MGKALGILGHSRPENRAEQPSRQPPRQVHYAARDLGAADCELRSDVGTTYSLSSLERATFGPNDWSSPMQRIRQPAATPALHLMDRSSITLRQARVPAFWSPTFCFTIGMQS